MQTPEDTCGNGKGKVFLDFAKECFTYEYKDDPNYSKLRFCLQKSLLNNGGYPQQDIYGGLEEIVRALRENREFDTTDEKEHLITDEIPDECALKKIY